MFTLTHPSTANQSCIQMTYAIENKQVATATVPEFKTMSVVEFCLYNYIPLHLFGRLLNLVFRRTEAQSAIFSS